jgi:hypothetical protein
VSGARAVRLVGPAKERAETADGEWVVLRGWGRLLSLRAERGRACENVPTPCFVGAWNALWTVEGHAVAAHEDRAALAESPSSRAQRSGGRDEDAGRQDCGLRRVMGASQPGGIAVTSRQARQRRSNYSSLVGAHDQRGAGWPCDRSPPGLRVRRSRAGGTLSGPKHCVRGWSGRGWRPTRPRSECWCEPCGPGSVGSFLPCEGVQ